MCDASSLLELVRTTLQLTAEAAEVAEPVTRVPKR